MRTRAACIVSCVRIFFGLSLGAYGVCMEHAARRGVML